MHPSQCPLLPSSTLSSPHILPSTHSLHLTFLFLVLSFLPPLMKTTPPSHLFHPSLTISHSFSHLHFFYSFPYLVPNSLFISISVPLSFILLSFSSCRLPAGLGPCCLSFVFARSISRLFLRGASCVCSPPYCVI